jgi:hypothetical protein
MKKIVISIGIIVLVITVIILVLAVIFGLKIPTIPNSEHSTEKHLSWDSSRNITQTGNTCSAHATMAYLYVQTKQKLDPNTIYSTMPYKMKNGYVYPWSINSITKSNGSETSIYFLGNSNDDKRTNWICSSIEKGNPVILVVGNEKYLHYITVLGYRNDIYNIYDSNSKVDQNSQLEGNVSIKKKDLYKWWKAASFMGIHMNIGITR